MPPIRSRSQGQSKTGKRRNETVTRDDAVAGTSSGHERGRDNNRRKGRSARTVSEPADKTRSSPGRYDLDRADHSSPRNPTVRDADGDHVEAQRGPVVAVQQQTARTLASGSSSRDGENIHSRAPHNDDGAALVEAADGGNIGLVPGADGRNPPVGAVNLQQQGRFRHGNYQNTEVNTSQPGSEQQKGVPIQNDIPDSTPGIEDPVGAHIPLKIKEKIWRGEYVPFGVLLKSAKDLSTDSYVDGDLVLKGGMFTVVNKKIESIHNIHTWTTAFIIYMDILLEKWPSKARELLKYMQSIRLAASRSSNNGWSVYDEQFRLKKARFPSSSWALIDHELWILYVATGGSQGTDYVSGGYNTYSASTTSRNIDARNMQTASSNFPSHNTFRNFRSGTSYDGQRARQKCFRYNEGRCTFGRKCKFEHSCSKCNGQHPAIKCFRN